ncbi:MAG: hypothetical protein IJZ06_03515 [Bacteroidales bacterium]|nr:hypothetical protein [Bacteroidales bacterium]
MTKNTLTTSDIMDLISDYKSEIRKLSAKITFCENRIYELEDMLTKNNSASCIEQPKQIRSTRKVESSRKPYPLSDWDRIILDLINEAGRPQLSKDIYEKAFIKAKEMGIFLDDEKSSAKINQCLVKLTNRRSDLSKVRYGGRGYAYCLPEWIDENGVLKNEYRIFE